MASPAAGPAAGPATKAPGSSMTDLGAKGSAQLLLREVIADPGKYQDEAEIASVRTACTLALQRGQQQCQRHCPFKVATREVQNIREARAAVMTAAIYQAIRDIIFIHCQLGEGACCPLVLRDLGPAQQPIHELFVRCASVAKWVLRAERSEDAAVWVGRVFGNFLPRAKDGSAHSIDCDECRRIVSRMIDRQQFRQK